MGAAPGPPAETLPAQIGCLGRYLVVLLQPWQTTGRAAAIDSTTLRANGGVWHKKDHDAGVVPHTSIENFNEQYKALFGGHGQVPTRGLVATRRYGLGPFWSTN